MPVEYVNPEHHASPAGAYSHVAIADPGRLAFIAGQVALDDEGGVVGGDDVGAQFEQVFRNLDAVLAGIGASFADVAELRTFVVGAESLDALRHARERVYAEYYPTGAYPPNTLVVVAGLAMAQLKVEVGATVVLRG